MKTFQYTIVTVALGGLALVVAPLVSGDSQRAEAKAGPLLLKQAAPVPAPAPVLAAEPPKPVVPPVVPKRTRNLKAADDFFAGPIVYLEINFEPQEWEYLKKDDRRYAECTIIETAPDGKKTTYEHAAVKVKGAAGSSQSVDAKPGLTISLDKYKGAERFHGMEKFQLNNGAQDGSLLNEYVGDEMCRAAGVPASRGTHVVVKWKGRELGLYLFKEAFTKDFLSYFYEKTDGSLYDGHFIAEIDGNMEKQQGGDPADIKDIKALAAACKEGDQNVRWQKVGEQLDVEEYLRSLAMETFLAHWDGYNFNRNNYRVYFDPKTKKASFFCHGMDQVFGDPNQPVIRDPGSLVGQAVWSNPEWKARYKILADDIYGKVLKGRDWDAFITAQGVKIVEALTRQNPQWGKDYQGQINGARDRVRARIAAIGKQFGDMPKPMAWQSDVAKIGGNDWRSEGGGGMSEEVADGLKCFHIRADASAAASWRRAVTLEPGKYRIEALVKVAGAEGGDASGEGAGLRISGGTRVGINGVKGTASWQKVAYEFASTGADVILVAELRSPKGEAWFQADSFQLTRLK